MDLLLIPFIVCIALVGIHVYFGQTVIQRGIIFIDLALAQWAALGYLVGHYLHIENEIGLFGIAFLFSCFAGLILTIMKLIRELMMNFQFYFILLLIIYLIKCLLININIIIS